MIHFLATLFSTLFLYYYLVSSFTVLLQLNNPQMRNDIKPSPCVQVKAQILLVNLVRKTWYAKIQNDHIAGFKLQTT